MKQLLLGTTGSRVGGAEAIKHSEVAGASGETAPQARAVAYGDMQAAARQLLLGQPCERRLVTRSTTDALSTGCSASVRRARGAHEVGLG